MDPPENAQIGILSGKYLTSDKSEKLASTPQLDMAHWFRPTAANYFSRIGKADILAALREAKVATAPAGKGQKGRPRRSRGAAYRRNGLAARVPARSRSRARDGFEGSDLKTRERPPPGGLSPAMAPSPSPVVLNRQGMLAARVRLSTGRPLHRLRRRAGRLTQMFLRPLWYT